MTEMEICPWCTAKARDTFSFECGSVRPSYVTPSPCQADSCRIGILRTCMGNIVATYPQRTMMLPHIRQARVILGMNKQNDTDENDPDMKPPPKCADVHACSACRNWIEEAVAEHSRMWNQMRSCEDQLIKVANHLGVMCGDGLPPGAGDDLGSAIIRKLTITTDPTREK